MKIKEEKGIAGVDTVMAIVTVMIFSTLIFSMIFNNAVENVKLKKETLAMIYITEIFENVGIESYENITQSNISNLVPEEVYDIYNVQISVTDYFPDISNNEIMKRITATLTYQVNGQEYSCTMKRIKAKE